MTQAPLTAWEFFAGGGMARAGLGDGWRTTFANDFDPGKAAAYAANFGDDHLREGDVWTLTTASLPGRADLAWASSPCQDFSLAGGRAGLEGGRSSALLGFWRLMQAVDAQGRAPRVIVIENVTGLLSSAGGRDFAALCGLLAADGWRFGAVEIDAALFVPQSRPRLFVIATREAEAERLCSPPDDVSPFRTRTLRQAHAALPADLRARWLPWRLPEPPRRNADLASVLDADAAWAPEDQTRRLLALCAPLHQARIEVAQASGRDWLATAYRRVRLENGVRVQRAELRVDGLAGCLRTPAGGSSRQFVVQALDGKVRSRRLTAREGARLMGLPDDYRLPAGETAAWRVIGDGVVAPVVRWLARELLEPLVQNEARAAA